jgi:hypothetical protein
MTVADPIKSDRERLLDQQHLVMRHVSWSFYEDLLTQIENRPLRVTFDHGRFVHRMMDEEQTSVVREFRRWVRGLKGQ